MENENKCNYETHVPPFIMDYVLTNILVKRPHFFIRFHENFMKMKTFAKIFIKAFTLRIFYDIIGLS